MNKKVVGAICAISTFFVLNSGAVTFAENLTQFSIDVSDAALQLTVPPTASIELNPTSSNAVFGTTNVTVSVATNNMNGYRLSMSVPTTDLIHNSLANTVIPTLSNSAPESTFPVNAWGYKVVDNDYLPVLATNAPASWTAESPTNGTSHILTLAAKVDGTKASGVYQTTLTFNVVVNPNSFRDTIVFNGNGSTSGSMTNQQIYQGETTRLNTNSYAKTGFLFNGWNTNANGLGIGYGDEDGYSSAISTSTKTITLYAQWICDNSVNTCDNVPSADGSNGYRGKTLQDAYEMAYVTNPGLFPDGGGTKHGLYVPEKDPTTGKYTGNYFEATSAADYEGIPANDLRFAIQDIGMDIDGVKVCDYATVVGSTATVLDLRDFNSYRIIKAADGRCWNQDNFKLDLLDQKVRSKIDSTNTNIDNSVLTSLYSGNRANGENYATAGLSYWGGSYTYTAPLMYKGDNEQIPTSYNGTDDPLKNKALEEGWKVGTLYNFCTISAGNYCYSNNAGVDKLNTAIDTEYDICPSGWRLATGSTKTEGADSERPDGGEYQALINAYGNITNLRLALRIPFSGYWINGTHAGSRGRYFLFWTSTYYNTSSNYILFGSKSVGFYEYGRHYGSPLRCINKK